MPADTARTTRSYRIGTPIGRGGFGTVYRADMLGEDGFTRPVALKVLNDDMGEAREIAQRFRDEARLLGLLRHRAIVQVDGLVHLGERQAVVMELIEGVDIGVLMSMAPLPVTVALEVVGEVAGALDAAWQHPGPDGQPLHILHRDIKPGNIRVTPAGEVKILDFGIARGVFGGREAKTATAIFGSDGYMAPERFDREDGPACDVYSLGIVLLEMLTAQPVRGISLRPKRQAEQVGERILAVEPPVPGRVAALIRGMLAWKFEERLTAKAVEEACWELRRDLDGPRLRGWADHHVRSAMDRMPEIPGDGLSGQVLAEGGTGAVSGEVAEGPEEASGMGRGAVVAVVGLVAVGLVLGAAWVLA